MTQSAFFVSVKVMSAGHCQECYSNVCLMYYRLSFAKWPIWSGSRSWWSGARTNLPRSWPRTTPCASSSRVSAAWVIAACSPRHPPAPAIRPSSSATTRWTCSRKRAAWSGRSPSLLKLPQSSPPPLAGTTCPMAEALPWTMCTRPRSKMAAYTWRN